MKIYITTILFSLIATACLGQNSIKMAKSTTSNTFSPKNIKNVKIFEQKQRNTLGPCEPSIAIDPTNPNNIVAGSVIDFVHYSNDGGNTWNTKKLTSEFGVWGDPVLVADSKGNFYYFHLSDPEKNNWKSKHILDRIVCQKSVDKGKTWSNGVGIGLNTPKQQDKPLVCINPKNDHIYVTWTEFDKYKSALPEHKSRILFSKSTDYGNTFSNPIQLNIKEGNCLDDDFTTEGVMTASDGKNLYATWCFDHNIYFTKSNDEGNSWNDPKSIFKQNAGWSISVPKVKRANGFPVLVVDNSNSKHKGSIYLNWADQNSEGITQIFISKSTNKGKTWSTPLIIEGKSKNAHQFFNWMSIDNKNGNIYIVYYETNTLNPNLLDVRLAISTDGGKNFTSDIISEKPFSPDGVNFFGDYNYIDSKNGVVCPIWTRADNGLLSIWTATNN